MKKIIYILTSALIALSFTSCVKGEDATDTKAGNVEALWRLIDEHYCFFEYKEKELGLDWDEVHGR